MSNMNQTQTTTSLQSVAHQLLEDVRKSKSAFQSKASGLKSKADKLLGELEADAAAMDKDLGQAEAQFVSDMDSAVLDFVESVDEVDGGDEEQF